jgi:hypothetical protein
MLTVRTEEGAGVGLRHAAAGGRSEQGHRGDQPGRLDIDA